MKYLREHIRQVLMEYNQVPEFHPTYNYQNLGEVEPIYRGMTLKLPYHWSREIRLLWKHGLYSEEWDMLKGTKFTERQIAEAIVDSLQGQRVGVHWTKAPRIASVFAKPEDAISRSHTYSVIFQALPSDVGFMPDEGMVFWDEAEWRQPPGTELNIIAIYAFEPGNKEYPEGEWHIIWAGQKNPIKIKT